MGAVLSFFRRKPRSLPDEIKFLHEQLQESKAKLTESRRAAKSILGTLTIGFVMVYAVAGLVFYFRYFSPDALHESILFALPLLVSPLLLFYILRFAVKAFVRRRATNAEAHTNTLLKRKKQALDEFKASINFDRVQQVLEAYDEGHIQAQAERQRAEFEKYRKEFEKLQQAQARAGPQQQQNQQQRAPLAGTVAAPGVGLVGPRPVRPVPPPNRTSFDRVIDFIVGDGPNQRFALICRNCKNHNGMALPEEFEYIEFYCVYCNAQNPARKKREVHGTIPQYLQGRQPESEPAHAAKSPEPMPGAHGMPVPAHLVNAVKAAAARAAAEQAAEAASTSSSEASSAAPAGPADPKSAQPAEAASSASSTPSDGSDAESATAPESESTGERRSTRRRQATDKSKTS
ncbi:hypothetical protein CAOG_03221 [Capsaspora owczarzaki ATCC 30864]|uniref:Endoplasmic reticulum junction formation protein lunapark n=1 Tax=Capsaspora owczarzaki (strain ATCC 30864) TaxID=595528 RepID=A0A0D2X2A3_CAPO3|nr:hypothetical protein CAOG_03221 [Capsaspora owczarzaki ATCC 30864]KJE92209.1 hypothetical protein CAOG_003221 [Capsaspora owczarzaki ATCC 30864]|eukprot:XP_004364060.1 hypothetical protein CAOG_03221 [Capsaspora owczarzaki ATCC 30864]